MKKGIIVLIICLISIYVFYNSFIFKEKKEADLNNIGAPALINYNQILITPKNPDTDEPNSFRFKLSRGEKVTGELLIKNPGNQEKEVFFFAVDSITLFDGNTGFKIENEEQEKLGAFIHFIDNPIRIKSEEKIAKFDLIIPNEFIGKEHLLGGIGWIENYNSEKKTIQTRKLIKITVEIIN